MTGSGPFEADPLPGLHARILDSLNDGVYVVNRDRRITYWNRAAERISGFTAEQAVGLRCQDNLLNHIDEDGTALCVGRCPLKETIADGMEREIRVFMHHRDGHLLPVNVHASPLRSPNGTIIGAVEVFRDDTATVVVDEQLRLLERETLLDPLTGVGNRRLLNQSLARRLTDAAVHGTSFALLVADLDRFKRVNDGFGHDIGDLALRTTAQTLANGLRPQDTVCRFGGEEFVVLTGEIDAAGLASFAERLRVLVRECRITAHDGTVITITASIGAALSRRDDDGDTLFRRADRMLYTAKEAGRDRVRIDASPGPENG